jgi:hypothetical protein
VVKGGQGALVVFDHSCVERLPATARIANLGNHDGVGVQVRVLGSARVLTEHRCRQLTERLDNMQHDAASRVPVVGEVRTLVNRDVDIAG